MNWNQLWTIIWLRWRLMQNQFAKAGAFSTVLAILATLFGVSMEAGAGIGGFTIGMFTMADAPPLVTMLAWDGIVCGFLFFWALGVVIELQRAESIDLSKLLHLPVSLEGVFAMNYLVSHVTFGIIIFLPGILGLCAGLVWASGPLLLLMFPLALSFVFMVSAWTYCVRGWLAELMVNPRRRRSVMMALTLGIILAGQLPNLYFHVYFPRHMKNLQAQAKATMSANPNQSKWENMVPKSLIVAQSYVPVFWLPKGAMALAGKNPWPAVAGSVAGFLVGLAGLARAYRSTIRFYRGEEKGGAISGGPMASTVSTKARPGLRANFMEREVPFVSQETAALAVAFFRSMSRAPEVKMTMMANFVVLVLFVPAMLFRFTKGSGETAQLFYATGAVGFTFFGMLQYMFNVFGFDREGFRSLVLSPAKRRSVLLAKNISLAPIVLLMGLGMLIVLELMIHLSVMEVAASVFKLGAVFILMCVMGNLISIWVPYRVSSGTLKRTKPPFKVGLLILATQLAYPIVMIPIFLAPLLGFVSAKMGWWPGPLVDGMVSAVLLGVAILVYAVTLNGLGEMLEEREKIILQKVTREEE